MVTSYSQNENVIISIEKLCPAVLLDLWTDPVRYGWRNFKGRTDSILPLLWHIYDEDLSQNEERNFSDYNVFYPYIESDIMKIFWILYNTKMKPFSIPFSNWTDSVV